MKQGQPFLRSEFQELSKLHAMSNGTLRSPISIFSGVVLALAIVLLCFASIGNFAIALSGKSLDELSYWAAGRQLLHHQNPYDRAQVLRMEQEVGFQASDRPMMMRNVPTGLLVAIALAVMPRVPSATVWSVLMLALLLVSVFVAWRADAQRNPLAYALGCAFGPAIASVNSGQMGALMLLGMVLFLAVEPCAPFWAGVALWLCFLKPQLFVPFGVVLLVWAWRKRRFQVVWGFVAAEVVSAAWVTLLDHRVWVDYVRMMRAEDIEHSRIPCLSAALQQSFSPNRVWVQYVPCVLALVWAIAYYWHFEEDWKWTRDGGLVLLVSLLVAPYAWLPDQAVLLPALLYVAARTSLPMIAVFAVLNVVIQLAIQAPRLDLPAFLLIMPMWLVWYLVGRKFKSSFAGNRSEMAVIA